MIRTVKMKEKEMIKGLDLLVSLQLKVTKKHQKVTKIIKVAKLCQSFDSFYVHNL